MRTSATSAATYEESNLYRFGNLRSQYLAEADIDAAGLYVGGGAGWYGAVGSGIGPAARVQTGLNLAGIVPCGDRSLMAFEDIRSEMKASMHTARRQTFRPLLNTNRSALK